MDDSPPVPPTSAAERPVFWDRWHRPRLNSLTLSILAHVFFGLIAAYLIVQTIPAKSKQTLAAPPSSPNAPSHALEHKVQMQRKQQTMSAPAAIKRITTTSNTKVALPAMPAMPALHTAVTPLALACMGGTGVDLGKWGGGSGGGSGPSLFGLRTGGEGLRGTFYDLKQTRNKAPTSIRDVPAFVHQLDLFLQSGWNESLLSQYFRAPTPLYATQFFVPLIASEQAPKAFGVENEVHPALWMALYKGQVSPPESGTYYFVGGGDNILIVRLRGSIVFDKSWNYQELFGIDRSWRPTAVYDYGYGNTPGGFSRGKPVELNAGEFYDMEVLLGDDGGAAYFSLLVEKQGVEYKKINGLPILPIFRTSRDAPPTGNQPPFQPNGPVWTARLPLASPNSPPVPPIAVRDRADSPGAVGLATNDAATNSGPLLVEPAAPEPAASPAASPAPKWNPVRLALRENREEENLWIDIGINGGRPLAYLLDTGSDSLFAAPLAWQSATRPSKPVLNTKVPEKISYGDNTYGYHYFPVRAQLAFFNAHAAVPALTLPNPAGYMIGQIVDSYSNDWPEKRRAMVRETPTAGDNIFGCRMLIAHGGDDKIGYYDLSNTLLQLPGVGGYVVTDNGPPGTASLTVGLNKAIREQFPQKISLSRGNDTFPDSNLHSCDESRIDVTFSHAGNAPVTIHNVNFGLDTGSGKGYGVALTSADARAVAPYLLADNGVREDRSTTTDRPVRAGTTVTFSFPSRPDGFKYSFVCPQYAGRWNSGPMLVKSQTSQESDVTAGIGFFEQFAVMYDIENGELGFRKTPPDLSARVLASP